MKEYSLVSAAGGLVVAIVMNIAGLPVFAQSITTPIDGSTPPVLAAGRAVGNFALTDFESVNLYGGGISFHLPIVPLGGQGAPGAPLYLDINQRWMMQFMSDETSFSYNAVTAEELESTKYYYSPGYLRIRSVGRSVVAGCPTGGNWLYGETLTRLVFHDPDGTEHDLVDAQSGGNVHTHSPPSGESGLICAMPSTSRGRVWISRDGSFMTYVSDAAVMENPYVTPKSDPSVSGALNGYLYKKDGTRIKIADGLVEEIRDRNGRFTTYTYGKDEGNPKTLNQVIQIVDPMNRTIAISYQQPDAAGGTYDTLTYPGTNGANRIVKVHYCDLLSVCANYEAPSGKTKGGASGLFPGFGSSSSNYTTKVVSYLELPDLRRYQFGYNSYGELIKVTLPTGGSIEYDHGSGVEDAESLVGLNSSGGSLQIYRRVLERRTYSASGTLATRTVYKAAHAANACPAQSAYSFCTAVTEEHLNALQAATVLSATRHAFVGGANDPASFFWNGYYVDYMNGREVMIAALDVSSATSATTAASYVSMAARTTSAQTWEQRACGTNEACPLTIGIMKASPVDPRLIQTVKTVVESAQTATITYGYDRFNNKTLEAATGYDQSELYRKTAFYLMTNAANQEDYARADLADSDANTKITNGVRKDLVHLRELLNWEAECLTAACTGTGLVAKREYTYDFPATLQASTGITQWENIPSEHSDKNYRGKLTKETAWLNSSGSSVTTVTRTYYDFGAPYEVTDGRSKTTTYTWGCNGNTIYTIKDALSHETKIVSDCHTGSPSTITDPNTVIETRLYDDVLDRVTSSTIGSYNKTAFAYNDSSRTIQTKKSRLTTGDSDIVTTSTYDGLGRTTETSRTDPEGDTRTQIQYDKLGRVWKVSAPFRGSAAAAWTETLYDDIGRVKSVTSQDGASTTYSYSGNTVTVRDPGKVKKDNTYDAGGRLVSVTEYLCPESSASCVDSTSYVTSYSYDSRGNLETVTQGSLSQRIFRYDMMGRLHTATNPESGLTTYEYDLAGNLDSKTDSRGKIKYGYDDVGRTTSKTYTGSGWAATSNVTYVYDEMRDITGASAENMPVGRLVEVSNAVSTTTYRYDGTGRALASLQKTTGLGDQIFKYQYLPAGISSMTYPSGRVVNWSYDVAGRPATATDGTGGPAFVSSATYDVTGGLGTISFGNGLQEKWTYSQQRGQVQSVMLGTSTTPNSKGSWQYSYCVGLSSGTECSSNNGNVVSQLINPLAATQSYTYDGMNRLKKYSESAAFYQTYVYDRYGNRALLEGSAMPSSPSFAVVTTDNPSSVDPIFTSNQWSQSKIVNGYVTEPKKNTYPTLSYDAEGRVATATTGASSSATYGYDGEGHRVNRTTSAGTTYYVYDAFGQLAAEFNPSNGVNSRQYITVDALGSTRAVTDANGNIVAGQRHDYAPFGWSLLSGQNGRTTALGYGTDEALTAIPILFTSKERDAETGLDYFGARYLSASQGRFTGPDVPLLDQDPADPQSWNLYNYVRNNPLILRDPSGQACVYNGPENGDLFDPVNYEDDDSGGQSCKDSFAAPPQRVTIGVGRDEAALIMLRGVGDKLSSPNEWADTAGKSAEIGLSLESIRSLPTIWQGFQRLVRGPELIKLGLEGAADSARLAELAEMGGLLRLAKATKGNYGLGTASAADANALGEAWVGNGYRVASDGKTLVSADGLRIYRPPSFKPNYGNMQANFEWKVEKGMRSVSNGHLTIR